MKVETHNSRAVSASTVLPGGVFIYRGVTMMKVAAITKEEGDILNAVDLIDGQLCHISDSTSVMLPSGAVLQVEI